jgi:CheY-like chemotaxis protein
MPRGPRAASAAPELGRAHIIEGEHVGKASIFLVEDEALIRMMIADMIEDLGHSVVAEAGTIEEAMPLAQATRFELAILDINVDGRSILPIAEIIESRGLPYIFASGYSTTGLPPPFAERIVLRKPFLPEKLSQAINAILHRR